MWPKLSQINDKIYKKITTRNNKDVSELNIWIRLFSGVGNGLIMVSNPDRKLFASAGESGIYGFSGNSELDGYSGALGVDWNGNGVNPKAGRSLRPSPIVTNLEVKEGEDQISREASIAITAFSLEQMEAIQKYFMEPGYSLFVEWGWNTQDGARGLIKTDNIYNIPSYAASGNLKQSQIRYKHTKTNGDYDSFLGFIIGGTVGSSGEEYNITIELRGTPELPTYLQNQNNVRKISVNDGAFSVETGDGAQGYPVTELEDNVIKQGETDEGVAKTRRFKAMINKLPAHRQTTAVKNLKDSFKLTDFLNLDKIISDSIISDFADRSFWTKLKQFDFYDDVSVEGFDVDRAKLFSNKTYIRFEKAIDILNQSSLKSYNVGGVDVSCSIDISKTVIGAFPLMYSVNPDVLLIPGKLPDFAQYFLSTKTVSYDSLISNAIDNPIGTIRFSPSDPLNDGGRVDKAGYYGYLKDLYINVDFLANKLLSKNKTFKDILFDILNDMSAAVNSYWDFQITETADDDDNDATIKYQIIDRNWVAKPTDTPKEFYHSGEKSRFLDASLDIDIPGEMANQIVGKRLKLATQTDAYPINVNEDTFFAKGIDRFLPAVTKSGKQIEGEEDILDKDIDTLTTIEEKEERVKANRESSESIIVGSRKTGGGYVGPGGGAPATFTYYDENGNTVKTVSGYGDVTYANTAAGRELKRIDEENQKLNKSIKETKESNLSSNLDKVDAIPSYDLVVEPEITEENVKTDEFFRTNFRVYTCRNTDLLDYLKNKGAVSPENKGRLSQPLPIKYSFTIVGTSGIRRGDMFNINGIPKKYKQRGLFQISGLEHTIEGSKWVTKVEALYRQKN